MAEAGPDVSVIIPTRNRAQLLRTALASILAQKDVGLEVIVVDDGSTDGTRKVVEAALASDPRVRSLRHDATVGAAAARNSGAAVARGRYFVFEDDDCRSRPRRIARLVSALETAPEAAYAYCWMVMRHPDRPDDFHGSKGPWAIATPSALIRRDAFRTVGGFDSQLPRLQDFDLWTRLLARYDAVEVQEVLFEMFRYDDGITASDQRLLMAADRLLTKYEHGEFPGSHLAAMHRRIAGRLLISGFRAPAVAHYRRAVSACRWCLRSVLGLTAALGGPAIYRCVARVTYAAGHWFRRG